MEDRLDYDFFRREKQKTLSKKNNIQIDYLEEKSAKSSTSKTI